MACNEPVLFIYSDGDKTHLIPKDALADWADPILKDMDNGKAQIFDVDPHSPELICGTLF